MPPICLRGLLHFTVAAAASAPVALPSSAAAQPGSPVVTEPCPELQPDARCGHVDVPLDRRAPGGAQVPIGFVVLPHTDTSHPPLEPIFDILGGPGEAASEATGSAVRNFGALRARRDVVLVDYRGEGRSDPIDCAPLQHIATDDMDELIDAVGACGAQLGDASDRYGAADVADDVDAVRAALDFPTIDLYGVSYGTVHAQAYALRHREHLRALILNGAMSPLDDAGSWELGISNAAAVAGDVAIACSRSPSCSRADDRPARTFAALARRLRDRPVDGIGRDVSGTARRLHVDEGTLVRIATAGDFVYFAPRRRSAAPGNDAELVAAAAALRRGDPAPLLRMAAAIDGPLIVDEDDPATFSWGDNAAAQCSDFPALLWDRSASFAERRAQFDAAIAHVVFGPFAPAAWADSSGPPDMCLKWPAPDDLAPVFTPQARFPDIPVLVVAATLDTSTTLAQSRFVAHEFSHSQLVVLRNGGHPPGSFTGCIPDAYARFLTTLDAGDPSCVTQDDPDRPAVGTFARRIHDAPQATSRSGDRSGPRERRLASVVWATVQDALRQSFRLPDPEAGSGAGLRGGSFDETFDFDRGVQELNLHGSRFSDDVAVDGRVDVDNGNLHATLTITTPRHQDDTLVLSGRWFTFDTKAGVIRLDGRLGGRTIAVSVPAG